ncbi:MAG: hypothetical protein M2R45_00168 [Verrucomicrobia subdivision 3 bacterium]|nr:hypothetical protein [Limisphaerales bacterium]MCS1412373.1 hypothetical protein [Limisphaerales bacterium]
MDCSIAEEGQACSHYLVDARELAQSIDFLDPCLKAGLCLLVVKGATIDSFGALTWWL